MRWENIHWDRGVIFNPRSKSRKSKRYVPLTERMKAARQPAMPAAVDTQHAGQRPSLAPLVMNPALAPLGRPEQVEPTEWPMAGTFAEDKPAVRRPRRRNGITYFLRPRAGPVARRRVFAAPDALISISFTSNSRSCSVKTTASPLRGRWIICARPLMRFFVRRKWSVYWLLVVRCSLRLLLLPLVFGLKNSF